MLAAGQKLKRARTALKLTFRDVEQASQKIAGLRANDEFSIALSRLADIENKGMVPTIYRIYTLCAIYRLEVREVLSWYGVDCGQLASDAAAVPLEQTHLIGFDPEGGGHVAAPVSIDPRLEEADTVFLSRMIQRWGRLPLSLLQGRDLRSRRYGFIGCDDWTMFPLITPGALVIIDEGRRKVVPDGWRTEFERPIYFFELREGFACGWCDLNGPQLILQPHPASGVRPRVFAFPNEIEVVGQVTGVAMQLYPTPARKRVEPATGRPAKHETNT